MVEDLNRFKVKLDADTEAVNQAIKNIDKGLISAAGDFKGGINDAVSQLFAQVRALQKALAIVRAGSTDIQTQIAKAQGTWVDVDKARRVQAGKNLKDLTEQNTGVRKLTNSARESATAFKQLFVIEDARHTQAGKNLRDLIEQNAGIRKLTNSARESASVFKEMYASQAKAERANLQTYNRTRPYTQEELATRNMRTAQVVQYRTTGPGAATNLASQASMLANFMTMGAAIGGAGAVLSNVVQLDAAMRNLQAITETTDAGMAKLRETVLQLSTTTKFSAVELANAGTILGQAGLSAQQTGEALKGVTLLAQATGSTLDTSVGIITTTMSAFNLQASDSEKIANTYTAALNTSKLSMDQLTTAMQYAAAPAAQLGMTYQETTAIMMAMAQAGVKSGSIIGTGMRQVFNQLAAPTPKLQKVLSALNIPLNQVDVQARGLIPVLKSLQEAGFGVTQAFQAFGTRGAGAFAIMQNQSDQLDTFHDSIIGTQAAAQAAETQMKAFSNTAKELGNSFIAAGSRGLTPFFGSLQGIMSVVVGATKDFQGFDFILQGLGTTLAVLATVKGSQYLISLTGITNATKAEAAATTVLTKAQMEAAVASKALQRANIWILGISTAIGVAMTAYSMMTNRNAEAQQKAAEASETARGKYESARDTYKAVGDAIQVLYRRQNDLRKGGPELEVAAKELEERFGKLGLSVDDLGGSYDKLLSKMQAVSKAARESMAMSAVNYVTKNREAVGELRQGLAQNQGSAKELSSSLLGTAPTNSSLGRVLSFVSHGNPLEGLDPNILSGARFQLNTLIESGKLSSRGSPGYLLNGSYVRGTPSQTTNAKNLLKLFDTVQDSLSKINEYNTNSKTASQYTAIQDYLSTGKGAQLQQSADALKELLNRAILGDKTNPLYLNRSEQDPAKILKTIKDAQAQVNALKAKFPIATLKQGSTERYATAQVYSELDSLLNTYLAEAPDAAAKEASIKKGNRAEDKKSIAAQLELAKKKMGAATNSSDLERFKDQAVDLTNQLYGLEADNIKATQKVTASAIATRLGANQEVQAASIASLMVDYNKRMSALLKTDFQHLAETALTQMETSLESLKSKYTIEDTMAALEAAQKALYDWADNARKAAEEKYGKDSTQAKEVDAEQTKRQQDLNRQALEAKANPELLPTTLGGLQTQISAQQQLSNLPYAGMTQQQQGIATGLQALDQASLSLKKNLGGTLEELVKGTKSLGGAFKDLAGSILESMIKVVTDKAANSWMNLLLGTGEDSGEGSGSESQGKGASGLIQQGISWIASLFSQGGSVPGYALGDLIQGPIKTRDSVYKRVQSGGFVLRQSAVQKLATGGDVLAKVMPGEMYFNRAETKAIGVNNLRRLNMGLATGGTVAQTIDVGSFAGKAESLAGTSVSNQKKPQTATNVYVMAPTQTPPTTPQDIVVAWSNDFLTNGATRKLVKQVITNG